MNRKERRWALGPARGETSRGRQAGQHGWEPGPSTSRIGLAAERLPALAGYAVTMVLRLKKNKPFIQATTKYGVAVECGPIILHCSGCQLAAGVSSRTSPLSISSRVPLKSRYAAVPFALPSPHDGATPPDPRRRARAHALRLSLRAAGRVGGHQEVLVLSCDPQTYCHVVRDDAGREWTIKAGQNLDAGSEYRVGNRWVGEDHPEVVARLASAPPDDR